MVHTSRDGGVLALVGDVGGTNCRFATASPSPGSAWDISDIHSYPCDDFPTFEDALATYIRQAGASFSGAAVAVAGPVEDGSVTMTNRPWRVSERQLASMLGVTRCRVLNDFEALAHALPALTRDHVRPLGSTRQAPPRGNLAVLGAGTGLGVAAYIRGAAGEGVLVGEGGHIAFAPQDDLEVEILNWLARRYRKRVVVEHLLSGPGLVNLHCALGDITGGGVKFKTPAAITAAVATGDAEAVAVADLFVRILGSVAGDIALLFGARGGVFVAGGVSFRLLSSRSDAAFRDRFDAKGDFSSYVTAIPTSLILHPHPGILGAACALRALAATSAAS